MEGERWKILKETFFFTLRSLGNANFLLRSVLKMHTKKCSLKFFLTSSMKKFYMKQLFLNKFSSSFRKITKKFEADEKNFTVKLYLIFFSKKSAIIEITGRAIKTHHHALRYRSQNILKHTQRNIFYESCRFSLSIFSSFWIALKHVRTHSASRVDEERERQ